MESVERIDTMADEKLNVACEPGNDKTSCASIQRCYKLRIESSIFSKPIKLSVSSGCLVSRLIRKYLEALKEGSSGVNSDIVNLKSQSVLLDRNRTIGDVLGHMSDELILLEAIVESTEPSATSTEKKRRRNSSDEPISTTRKKSRESSKRVDESLIAEQAEAFAYWDQVNSVRKALRTCDDEFDDDELALGIALSLSDPAPTTPTTTTPTTTSTKT
jgi:hypothetical protein